MLWPPQMIAYSQIADKYDGKVSGRRTGQPDEVCTDRPTGENAFHWWELLMEYFISDRDVMKLLHFYSLNLGISQVVWG